MARFSKTTKALMIIGATATALFAVFALFVLVWFSSFGFQIG